MFVSKVCFVHDTALDYVPLLMEHLDTSSSYVAICRASGTTFECLSIMCAKRKCSAQLILASANTENKIGSQDQVQRVIAVHFLQLGLEII